MGLGKRELGSGKGNWAQEKGIGPGKRRSVSVLAMWDWEFCWLLPLNPEQHFTEGSQFLGGVEGAVLGVEPLRRTQGWLKDTEKSTEICARALASALPTFPCAWKLNCEAREGAQLLQWQGKEAVVELPSVCKDPSWGRSISSPEPCASLN